MEYWDDNNEFLLGKYALTFLSFTKSTNETKPYSLKMLLPGAQVNSFFWHLAGPLAVLVSGISDVDEPHPTSSIPFLQSATPSHRHQYGTHVPSRHSNVHSTQEVMFLSNTGPGVVEVGRGMILEWSVWVQFFSSVMSASLQSLSPSHTYWLKKSRMLNV